MYAMLLKLKYLFSKTKPSERLVAENAKMYILLKEMYDWTKHKQTRWAKRTRRVLDGHIETEEQRKKEEDEAKFAASIRSNLQNAYRTFLEESHPGHPMNHGDH